MRGTTHLTQPAITDGEATMSWPPPASLTTTMRAALGQPDEDDFIKKLAALGLPADALLALGVPVGAGLDAIKQHALRPLFGGALGGINQATNVYQRAHGFQPLPEPDSWSPEGLRRFSQDEAERTGWGGQLIEGVATDPLTYVGGPLGKVARAGEALPLVGGALGKVAAADRLY